MYEPGGMAVMKLLSQSVDALPWVSRDDIGNLLAARTDAERSWTSMSQVVLVPGFRPLVPMRFSDPPNRLTMKSLVWKRLFDVIVGKVRPFHSAHGGA